VKIEVEEVEVEEVEVEGIYNHTSILNHTRETTITRQLPGVLRRANDKGLL
jgi:hypothetical protein